MSLKGLLSQTGSPSDLFHVLIISLKLNESFSFFARTERCKDPINNPLFGSSSITVHLLEGEMFVWIELTCTFRSPTCCIISKGTSVYMDACSRSRCCIRVRCCE